MPDYIMATRVHDDLPGLMNCAKAGPLGSVPGMLTHK